MNRAERTRAKYAQLLAELRADPELLKELHSVLREAGYEQFAQIGEAAEMRNGFVARWAIARKRRQAAG